MMENNYNTDPSQTTRRRLGVALAVGALIIGTHYQQEIAAYSGIDIPRVPDIPVAASSLYHRFRSSQIATEPRGNDVRVTPTDPSATEAPTRRKVIVVPTDIPVKKTVTTAEKAPESIRWWQDRYDESWESEWTENESVSQSPDSWDHYNLAYSVDGATAMFRASGNTKYLDQALLLINNVVKSARPSSELGSNAFRDSYQGWIANKNGQNGEETPLYESYLWRYATRTLLAMRQNEQVYGDPEYRAQYNALLAFSEKHIFDKWYSRGVDDNIYRQNAHMAAHWAYIASNISQLTTSTTRRSRANKIIDDINNHLPNYGGNSLHGQMRPNPHNSSAYIWNADWGDTGSSGSDVSHANGVMAYIVEAHDSGVGGWTDADMKKFVALFDTVAWPANGECPEFLDGSGQDNCWFPDGLVKLGRYDAKVAVRLRDLQIARGPQLYGNGALNVALLGGVRR